MGAVCCLKEERKSKKKQDGLKIPVVSQGKPILDKRSKSESTSQGLRGRSWFRKSHSEEISGRDVLKKRKSQWKKEGLESIAETPEASNLLENSQSSPHHAKKKKKSKKSGQKHSKKRILKRVNTNEVYSAFQYEDRPCLPF